MEVRKSKRWNTSDDVLLDASPEFTAKNVHFNPKCIFTEEIKYMCLKLTLFSFYMHGFLSYLWESEIIEKEI